MRLYPDLAESAYPSPAEAEAEVDALVGAHPALATCEEIGRSREDRPLRVLRLRGGDAPEPRPRLLVTAHIHAVEYVGSFAARALLRLLLEGYGLDPRASALLDRAEVWVAPLLNPDGAERVWRRRGRGGFGASRFTAGGVDPNRNFPFVERPGRGAWNSGRGRPGSPYYRGPHPLSEPECRALAGLAARERFCAALNFHSFGCVIYMPEPHGADRERAARGFDVFRGPFQDHQRHRRYRPVPERPEAIVGQLDAFLYGAFGTLSVTLEVSRPGWHLLDPRKLVNFFWWSNPPDPARWADNDAPAALAALHELLERTGGRPCAPAEPELAEGLPDLAVILGG